MPIHLDLTGLLNSLGTFAIGGLFFTWLVREVSKRLLDAVAARDQASLARQNSEALEHLKSELAAAAQQTQARLQRENSESVERLKAYLNTIAHEVQARSSSLVAKQAEVIEEMNKLLVDAEEACRRAMNVAPSQSADAPIPESVRLARDAYERFSQYFERHRLYLTSVTAEHLSEIRSQLHYALGLYTVFGPHSHADVLPSNKEALVREAWEHILKTIPDERLRLEHQFRTLLGVPTQTQQLPSDIQTGDTREPFQKPRLTE